MSNLLRPMNLKLIKERNLTNSLRWTAVGACLALALSARVQAQTLINVDFGVGTASLKTGDGRRRHGHQ